MIQIQKLYAPGPFSSIGLLLILGHMPCSFQKLLIAFKNFGPEESKIPSTRQFCQIGTILKGRDSELCEDPLVTPNLKFTSGFCHPILNECKRGRESSFSEEDKQHFKIALHTGGSLYHGGSSP